MPLQASGKIKMSELAAQFGSAGKHKMTEFLRGGSGKVANTTVNNNVATSGKQQMSDYYSTGNPVVSVIFTETTNSGTIADTVSTTSAERGSNTRLIIIGGGAAESGSANAQCTVTGKSVTKYNNPANSDDSDRQSCYMFGCDVGNESSFDFSLTRGMSGRGSRTAVIQIDNSASVASVASQNSVNSGSAQRTLTISDPEGLVVYSGQTSFDSRTGSGANSNSHFFKNIAVEDDLMTQIFSTQTGNPGGQVFYRSSLSNPTGSVTVGHLSTTGICSRGGCTLGGSQMCAVTGYFPY